MTLPQLSCWMCKPLPALIVGERVLSRLAPAPAPILCWPTPSTIPSSVLSSCLPTADLWPGCRSSVWWGRARRQWAWVVAQAPAATRPPPWRSTATTSHSRPARYMLFGHLPHSVKAANHGQPKLLEGWPWAVPLCALAVPGCCLLACSAGAAELLCAPQTAILTSCPHTIYSRGSLAEWV